MTIYAPTDVRAIHAPRGCDTPHEAGALAPGERWALTCAPCEPHILAMRTGWAAQPDAVSLTPDERYEIELAEKTAARERNRTWGDPATLSAAFAAAIHSGPAPAAPNLLEQLEALTADERKALRAMLSDSDAPTDPASAEPAAASAGRK
ncbi:MAG TPA: hypothetical protein VHA75_00835, partial [Rugosimonospora sp.]|nr:hypothetical protein [Rugosimonospora sp.]